MEHGGRPGTRGARDTSWRSRARHAALQGVVALLRATGRRPDGASGERTDETVRDGVASGEVVDVDVPVPLTKERIAAWLAEENLPYFVDNDGDVGGVWGGRLFYAFCFGERGEILQVRGQWHRDLTIERLPEVLEFCNGWNADTILPKAYARVRDDGMVLVVAESATDLEHGVTHEQLGRLMRTGVAAAGALFERLDQLYPDPVRTAP